MAQIYETEIETTEQQKRRQRKTNKKILPISQVKKKTFVGSFTLQIGKWKQSIQSGVNITF